MNRSRRVFRPQAEVFEGRLLLSGAAAHASHPLRTPGFFHPERPNTPVSPHEAPYSSATFIDPSVHLIEPKRMAVGSSTYIAPFALLDGTAGFVSVGNGTIIGDNASLIANPARAAGNPGVLIGNVTLISQGATVRGPSAIGAFAPGQGLATYVGPNAVIDGANLAPGSYVSALARVGPGVTIPTGIRVLPGANVTTQAEAIDPALGKVVPLTTTELGAVAAALGQGPKLAAGYATLYQGNPVTGRTDEAVPKGVYNGNLATVLGVSAAPDGKRPTFTYRNGFLHSGTNPNVRPRVIGNLKFGVMQRMVLHRLGKGTSIRADEGLPMTIGSVAGTGRRATIHNPLNAGLTVGQNLSLGAGAVLLGGTSAALGDNVAIGDGAVVAGSSLGSGAAVGARSYIANSTVPAGTVIPPGTILINNTVVGTVQW